MAKGGKAKIASKNDPTARKKAGERFFQGQRVKPLKYISREEGIDIIVAQYDNGSMAEDENGSPMEWSNIS